MTRAYLRLDPDIGEKKAAYPDGAFRAFVEMLTEAEDQPRRGRFKSLKLLRVLLGKRARWVAYLIEKGDLIEQKDGSWYVDGWDEWQEGDWKVYERVARIRGRKVTDQTVTDDTVPTVTSTESSDSDRTDSRGRARAAGAEAAASISGGGGGKPAPRRRPTNGSIEPERPTSSRSAQEILDDPDASDEAKAGARAWLDLRGTLPAASTARTAKDPSKPLDFG